MSYGLDIFWAERGRETGRDRENERMNDVKCDMFPFVDFFVVVEGKIGKKKLCFSFLKVFLR